MTTTYTDAERAAAHRLYFEDGADKRRQANMQKQLRRDVEARLDREATTPRANAAGAPALPCPRCGARTHPTLDEYGCIDREHRHCLMCGDVRVVPIPAGLFDEVLPEGMHQPRRAARHDGVRL